MLTLYFVGTSKRRNRKLKKNRLGGINTILTKDAKL